MQRLALAAVLGATALFAQTAETIPFRAIMLPTNEVPAINIAASGAATVWLHVVRDAQGRVTSASTDFNVTYAFPGTTTITGLHIHDGAAGVNGPVRINTGIGGGANSVVSESGRGVINRQAQTTPTDAAGLDTVNGMLTNPANYYVNLHTTEFPGGVIRGQLMRAEMTVLMGFMSPRNEVPAIIDTNASGISSVIVLATRDQNRNINSAQAIFDLNYQGFTEGTQFTGFHIHDGAAGVNGPVTINTGMQGGANAVPANPGGANLHYEVEVPVENIAALRTVYGLFENPQNFYINLHSAVNPGGVIRSQLRRTDRMHFSVMLSPANEVPAITDVNASAPSAFTLYTARDGNGDVAGAVAIFDVNYRFPGNTTFTGLHIHNGTATENGGVTINTGLGGGANSVVTETGFGNIYRAVTVSTTAALATSTSAAGTPERHYMNLHTSTHPGGIVRAQLAGPSTARPDVYAVISAVSDPALITVAPFGLMTVFGTNLVRVPSDVQAAFDGTKVPASFNGTQVTIGGTPAPLVTVTPDYIVAQVPVDAQAGNQPVVVRTPAGSSAPVNVRVAAVAPALFFDAQGGLFVSTALEFTGRPNAAARRGDILTTFSTGLGNISGPAGTVTTGQIVPAGVYAPADVSVLVDGRPTRVVGTVAVPGYLGLYMTTFMLPPDARVGTVPVQLRMGEAASNPVNLTVQ